MELWYKIKEVGLPKKNLMERRIGSVVEIEIKKALLRTIYHTGKDTRLVLRTSIGCARHSASATELDKY